MAFKTVGIGNRLGFRLIFTTLTVLGGAWGISIIHTVESEREILSEQLDRHADSLCGLASIFCVEPLLIEDYDVLLDDLNSLVERTRDLAFVRVARERDNKIVAESLTPDESLLDLAHIKEYIKPIPAPYENKVLGHISIGLSTKRPNAFIDHRTKSLLGQALTAFVVLAIFLYIFLRSSVISPLLSLHHQAIRFSNGDLDRPVQLRSRNEFGQLAASFEEARVNLNRSYDEIRKQNDELKELDRLKDEFLATMSHEIRTPMNGVIGMTELLSETELSSEQREYVETIAHSGENLLVLINDILDFSRIRSRAFNLVDTDFDVRTLISDTMDMLAENAHSKDVELTYFIERDVPSSLKGDSTRLRQILTNLLGNAVKFTDRGGVTLRVSRHEEEREFYRFEVQDTGIGIPNEAIPHLFDRFSQVDGSFARKYGGTGLGLAIVKQLIEVMDGQIQVESTPGEGSRFTFTVRLQRSDVEARDLIAQPDLTKMKVLVCDDNAATRSMVSRQLESWGIKPETAISAHGALTRLEEAARDSRPFDALILERELPDLGGLETAQRIQAQPELVCKTVILIHSFGGRPDPVEAARSGVSFSLNKPVRPSRLFDALIGPLVRRTSTSIDNEVEEPPPPPVASTKTIDLRDRRRTERRGDSNRRSQIRRATTRRAVDSESVPSASETQAEEKTRVEKAAPAPTTSDRPPNSPVETSIPVSPPRQMPGESSTAADSIILVVEDNRVNQKLVTRMLTKRGYTVDVAANGLEAVEAQGQKDYALIFMDCQMPEMDGFEATRTIREKEEGRESHSHVPIVALTANAMAGDRERCLASGMDDYIAKPLKQAELDTALRKWIQTA